MTQHPPAPQPRWPDRPRLPARCPQAPASGRRLLRTFPSVADHAKVSTPRAWARHVNEKIEAASPKELEEAPEAVRSAAPTEPGKRRPRRPEELRGADLRGQDLRDVKGLLPEH